MATQSSPHHLPRLNVGMPGLSNLYSAGTCPLHVSPSFEFLFSLSAYSHKAWNMTSPGTLLLLRLSSGGLRLPRLSLHSALRSASHVGKGEFERNTPFFIRLASRSSLHPAFLLRSQDENSSGLVGTTSMYLLPVGAAGVVGPVAVRGEAAGAGIAGAALVGDTCEEMTRAIPAGTAATAAGGATTARAVPAAQFPGRSIDSASHATSTGMLRKASCLSRGLGRPHRRLFHRILLFSRQCGSRRSAFDFWGSCGYTPAQLVSLFRPYPQPSFSIAATPSEANEHRRRRCKGDVDVGASAELVNAVRSLRIRSSGGSEGGRSFDCLFSSAC